MNPTYQAVFDALPEPKPVWKHFLGMMQVPRESGHPEQIRAWLLEQARTLGLQSAVDRVGNVVIRKPATPGLEGRPSICLQAHMDMVCEKTKESTHNFDTDALVPRLLDGNTKLMATNTTLGADNGIGDAMALAILEDRTIQHGPIECLFTVDEETTMKGAAEIEAGFLQSHYLINVDSEEDWRICIGCAGGFEAHIRQPLSWIQAPGARIQLELHKLLAGHSGVEIHKGRANANKLLCRLLHQGIQSVTPFALLQSLVGGTKKNVIPGASKAVIVVPEEHVERVMAALHAKFEQIKTEWKTAEPEMELAMSVLPERTGFALCPSSTRKALDLILAVPHGVLRMSPDVAGLVESSINAAKVTLAHGHMENHLQIEFFARSSNNNAMPWIYEKLGCIARLAGAQLSERLHDFPGWLPNMASPLLATAKQVFTEVMKKEPEIYAIHAGLECGMFQAKYPGMDCISVGPYMTDVHSPKETLYVNTVPKVYELLVGIIRNVH
ncbi:aminoacyl-histidine dipeptidase [Paratrimastix pyriformis]|uniref:Aminoacyl-histidine dipeptidase n=1 Tax=Paratrimastix pyriformis TaxID=342808 RepID=A0ABQ8UIW2_9EUKA|nr:aminoacyl-histidine dipeptidase [Paratrimastix pyriformis]